MIFSSPKFILLFLPIAFLGYFYLNRIRLVLAGKAWLVAVSLFFYASGISPICRFSSAPYCSTSRSAPHSPRVRINLHGFRAASSWPAVSLAILVCLHTSSMPTS